MFGSLAKFSLIVVAGFATLMMFGLANAAPSTMDDPVLFLGVLLEDVGSVPLTEVVGRHLRLNGYLVVDLSPAHAAKDMNRCVAADCLSDLADAYHVQKVLSIRVSRPDSAGVTSITAGLLIQQNTVQKSTTCVDCSRDQLNEKIIAVSDDILNHASIRKELDEKRPTATPLPASAVGSLAPRYWTPARIAGVVTLGSVSIALLAVGGALLRLDGQPGTGPCLSSDSPLPVDTSLCTYHTQRGAIASFIGGALSGGGAIIAATIPLRRSIIKKSVLAGVVF